MDLDLADAVVLEFPLRGEWCALNTPAERIPSHGTDYFGQRYAFDFVQLDADGRFHPQGLFRHVLGALPASAFYCWDQPVFSAGAGRVLAAGDGWPDRRRVNAIWELMRASWIGARPSGADYRPLTGNYVLLEGADGVALYAHLRNGSLRVTAGERVESGALLGSVGNSGNSTMPHLHFHLMDGPDPLLAAGVLCAFRRYERFYQDAWQAVDHGVPGPLERVRAG